MKEVERRKEPKLNSVKNERDLIYREFYFRDLARDAV